MHTIARQLFAFLFLVPFLSVAQEGAPTLPELIDAALGKDFKLANQKIDMELNTLDRKKLKEAFLPRVTLGAADAYLMSSFSLYSPGLSIPSLNINIAEGDNRFTSRSNLLTTDLSVSALLFSGGKVTQLRKALEEKQKALALMMESNKQEIVAEVISAYDQLALLRQVNLVLEESRKRLDADRKTADKALGYGLITKYEHQKIEVAQAQLASRRLDYEGKLEVVLEYLYLLTDIDKGRLEQILPVLATLELETEAFSIEKRPEMAAYDAVIAASRYKLSAEKTWIVPKVQALASVGYVGLSMGHIKSSDPVTEGGERLSKDLPNFDLFPLVTVGVALKWELFNGNEGHREVQKARLEITKEENEKSELSEKLELNLAQSRTSYRTATAKVSLSAAQEQTASNALTQATAEYRNGLIKSSQLVEAEEDFQDAALGYLQAVFNQRRAAVSLLRAGGELTSDAVKQ